MRNRVIEFFDDYRGFEQDAKKLVVVWMLASVGDAPVWFLLSLYLNYLGYSPVELGNVIFLMSVFSVLPLLPAGYISDRFGRKRMIFIGICIYVIGLALLIRADTLTQFYVGASIWGLGHSMYMPSFMGFLSGKVDERRRKYLFGFQMFAGMMASASTVLIIGFLPELLSQQLNITMQDSYRRIFFIGLCFYIIQILPLMFTKKEREESVDIGSVDYEEKRKLPPLPKLTLLKLCIPMALFGLGAGLVVPFFQVYFQWRFNTSVEDIGILFAFTQFLWAAAYLITPNLAERRGSVRAITAVHTAAIIALIAIPVSPNFFFVSMAYITRMVLMNSTWPIFQSYSLTQVPKEHRSFTLSSTNFSFNGARSITPIIAGYLFAWSLELPFFLTAILYTIATTSFYYFFRKRDDRISS
jgi:MFS family permease